MGLDAVVETKIPAPLYQQAFNLCFFANEIDYIGRLVKQVNLLYIVRRTQHSGAKLK